MSTSRESGTTRALEPGTTYHVEPSGRFVEASYLVHGDGLRVYGSASQNADGNCIAWHEDLHRREAPPTERT